MPTFAALACLGVLGAISGCFDLKYDNCRITCKVAADCPPSLRCVIETGDTTGTGLCAPSETMTCSSESPDAGADAGAMDAGPDGTDAMDGGGTDADGGSLPPQVLCHAGNCLTLPEAVRSNLVLLLWPSNLPAVGSAVSVWSDQSGYGNDAHALYASAPPRVITDGVRLDSTQLGSGFVVGNSASLDFGSGDFAIIVVGGLSSSTSRVSFFRQSDRARTNSRQISVDWVLSSATTGRPQGAVNDTLVLAGTDLPEPSVDAYTLRRVAGYLELRHNGGVLGSADLPTSGVSTTNGQDVYVGVSDLVGSPADSIAAVIALRGQLNSSDLDQLEAFLRTLFATAP